MSRPLFDQAQTDVLVDRLRELLDDELELDLGKLEAEALFSQLARDIGAAFYNRGLHDARAAISARLDEIGDAIYTLERPSAIDR